MNPIYFLALMSLALLGSATAVPKKLVEDLCSLDAKALATEITKRSDIKQIIESLNSDQSIDCPAKVKSAILALEPAINLEDVCSEKAADTIVDFWADYVYKKSKLRKNLPKPLKNFFISFGLQVSKVCKSTMINELQKASNDQGITSQDIQFVTRTIKESEKVRGLFGKEPKIEDLTIIIRTDSAEKERKKMNLPPKHMKYFELMQERCLNKFKPIYDTLVSPVVRLASIGMNYKAVESFDAFLKEPIYYDWFNVIVACEPFAIYEAVLIPANKLDAHNNTVMVTVLDQEDIDELKNVTGLTLKEPEIREPIDYKVEVKLDDQIIDNDDAHLIKSMEGYGRGLDEMDKLRWRLTKRFPSILRYMIKSKTVQFGLKPVETGAVGKTVKFGIGRKSKNRLKVVAVALSLLGIGVTAIWLGLLFAGPWAPLPVIIGILIIATVIVLTPFVYASAPGDY